ncbi:hypothetical protein Clacol_000840 [Clathrus columnatus]|uniref:O-methyltransferase C-terminal domain-containing protein n=1 Tax=Clathrus columnatus TaxID=1419009 RepID=A0AAV4ZX84_9AGAM|nr:hypothetical protein Clacol_000840 [Clathrus columnatus]
MTLSKLHDLLNLLTNAVTQLEEACTKNGTSIPDLDKPFNTSSEDFRKDPTAALAANIIGAAALHICAIINPPQISLFDIASGTQKSAAFRICLESNVAEILQEAGPQNTSGLAALLSFQLDEASKALAHMWEVFSDPTTVKSNEPSQSAFTKFVGRGKTLWEYYDDPEQDFRRHRFNIGMHGVQRFQPENIILSSEFAINVLINDYLFRYDPVYDWKAVPAGSALVDVGGGVGTTQLCLAKEFPQLKIIIQDRSHVWREKDPDALESGRVSFEAQDFFEPQPQRDVSFFFLKQILHDWPDEYCIKILTQLRKAASPNTKLLSMDTVIQHACHDNSDFTGVINGAMPDEAPFPLLANWGAVNPMGYRADMIMLAFFNSRERTLRDAISLFEKSGWRLTERCLEAPDPLRGVQCQVKAHWRYNCGQTYM